MKKRLLLSLLLAVMASGLFARPVAPADPYRDYIYQYSVIDALLAGVYDGNLEIGDLQKRGDFGIGTFNRLACYRPVGGRAGFEAVRPCLGTGLSPLQRAASRHGFSEFSCRQLLRLNSRLNTYGGQASQR